jgi:uncharacterized Zn-binding protein involved in type VI secretion
MTLPAARLTDLHLCALPSVPPPPSPVPIPILQPGAPTVLIGNLPAARMGDLTAAAPPHPIIKGSATVLICNQPAARVADNCACGGVITPPCMPTVLIGG